jgi:hypothetical protein
MSISKVEKRAKKTPAKTRMQRENNHRLCWTRHQSSTTFPVSTHAQQFCSGSTTSQARSFRHWSPCKVAGDSSKHHFTADENSGPASSLTSSAHCLATIKRISVCLTIPISLQKIIHHPLQISKPRNIHRIDPLAAVLQWQHHFACQIFPPLIAVKSCWRSV